MSFINVIAHGNLTRDPQIKALPGGTTVTEFGIASNRRYKTAAGEQREEVCFLDATAFGKTGENIHKFFQKGKAIILFGRLKMDSWDAKDGSGKRTKHVLIVDNFDFVGSKGDGDQGGDSAPRRPADDQRQPQRQSRPAPGQRPETPQQDPPYGEEKMFEENDIPFIWSGRQGEPV